MEKVQIYLSVATSVITFVTLVYNLVIKNGNSREKRYYNKILQPFISKWYENKEISAVETIKDLVKSDDDDIPKYISYLISEEDDDETEEKLKKVLLYDYAYLYPNDANGLNKISDNIFKVSFYILFFFAVIFLSFGLLIMVEYLIIGISIIVNLVMNNRQFMDSGSSGLIECGYYFVIGIILIVLSILVIKTADYVNTDRYNLNKKKICYMINKKVEGYNRIEAKEVF